MAFQGVIFDFNGVLLWDTHLQEAAWARFAQTLRATTFSPEEMLVHMHGRTNRYVLEYLTQQRLASEEVATLTAAKEGLYRELCLEQGSAFCLSPGATELLDWLQAEGIPTRDRDRVRANQCRLLHPAPESRNVVRLPDDRF